MSAVLYYGLDTPALSDAEFDAGCLRLIAEWDTLQPIRKWQLGTPELLHTTGYHIKATVASVAGAVAWAGIKELVVPSAKWKHHKAYGRWLNAGSFSFG